MTQDDQQIQKPVEESVLRKIQKALALATNNSNQNEAFAAMLQAQRLMAKHNLSMEMFSDTPSVAKDISEIVHRQSRIEWFDKDLANIVAKNFRCYAYWSSGYAMKFLGLKQDVELCKEVYSFAKSALRHCTDKFMLRVSGERKRDIKKSYIKGFVLGLKEAFANQVEEESLQLVLVKDQEVEDRYSEKRITVDKTPSTEIGMLNVAALLNGYEDGSTLDQRRKRLK